MEFPYIGDRCPVKNCKQFVFLPLACDYCKKTFCNTHYTVDSHKCPKFRLNVVSSISKLSGYVCAEGYCKKTSPIAMLCDKCKLHLCLEHRHHACSSSKEDETKKLKKWQIPKKQFAEAKAIAEKEVSNSLKKSKNTAMANKVRHMRLKGSSIGPRNIPMNERSYFLVYQPLEPRIISHTHIGPAKGVFVNVNWTIGKATDSIADTLFIFGTKYTPTACHLKLFHHATGLLICNESDTSLRKLLDDSELVDGQAVILEYSDDSVEPSSYK